MNIVGQIYISPTLFNKLEIPMTDTVQVRVGAKVETSKLVIKEGMQRGYMLSPRLAKALVLSRRNPLQIRYDYENEMFHIGPTIGILTTFLPNQTEFNPKSVQAELIYLSNLCRNLSGQIFIFTPGSINWVNKTTRGFLYRQINAEHGMWVSSLYPLPDVVYDRIASRAGEARAQIKNTKKKLMNMPYLKYFNPSFLNKWIVHKLLVGDEKLAPYLPETHLLNLSNLKYMISKYRTLYLKPCNGSLGSGIIKVNCHEDGKLSYTVYKNGRHNGRTGTPADLLRRTFNVRDGRSYLVQQGIALATFQDSIFDIRVIYQKNEVGEWQISKLFARVAPRGTSVANLSRGGRPETSKKVFAKVLNKNKNIIKEKNEELRNLCNKVATSLENNSKKLYGELGLDIGIDKNGNLWLIEVNSKPRKTTETELSQGIVRNTFRRPLQYGIFLAGFKNRK